MAASDSCLSLSYFYFGFGELFVVDDFEELVVSDYSFEEMFVFEESQDLETHLLFGIVSRNFHPNHHLEEYLAV